LGGQRIALKQLWNEYVHGKQTYLQLASKYNVSIKTIQRMLDKVSVGPKICADEKDVIVLMDSTFWGRGFGIMVWKDAKTKKTLLKKYIRTEKTHLYNEGLQEICNMGYKIKAIVCDGKRGLLQSIKGTPVQMCQFHQVAIVTRYITRKPRIEPAKELKGIMHLLSRTDKESFEGAITAWHKKWQIFLNERSKNPETGKTSYTHKRLRSAYRSITTNFPWLFTWYDYPDLKIPNTNNILEGSFTDLKNKLRNHNGLSIKRKQKFVDEFF
jgi:hypothetical protein